MNRLLLLVFVAGVWTAEKQRPSACQTVTTLLTLGDLILWLCLVVHIDKLFFVLLRIDKKNIKILLTAANLMLLEKIWDRNRDIPANGLGFRPESRIKLPYFTSATAKENKERENEGGVQVQCTASDRGSRTWTAEQTRRNAAWYAWCLHARLWPHGSRYCLHAKLATVTCGAGGFSLFFSCSSFPPLDAGVGWKTWKRRDALLPSALIRWPRWLVPLIMSFRFVPQRNTINILDLTENSIGRCCFSICQWNLSF